MAARCRSTSTGREGRARARAGERVHRLRMRSSVDARARLPPRPLPLEVLLTPQLPPPVNSTTSATARRPPPAARHPPAEQPEGQVLLVIVDAGLRPGASSTTGCQAGMKPTSVGSRSLDFQPRRADASSMSDAREVMLADQAAAFAALAQSRLGGARQPQTRRPPKSERPPAGVSWRLFLPHAWVAPHVPKLLRHLRGMLRPLPS